MQECMMQHVSKFRDSNQPCYTHIQTCMHAYTHTHTHTHTHAPRTHTHAHTTHACTTHARTHTHTHTHTHTQKIHRRTTKGKLCIQATWQHCSLRMA